MENFEIIKQKLYEIIHIIDKSNVTSDQSNKN